MKPLVSSIAHDHQNHREVRKGGNRTYKFLRKFDTGKLPTKQNGLKNGFPEELGLLGLLVSNLRRNF